MNKQIGIIVGYLLIAIATIVLSVTSWVKPAPTPAQTPTRPTGKWPEQILVGSFPKGSAAYPVNAAIAYVIGKHTPARGIVKEYPGGVPGIIGVDRGEVHMYAISQYDAIQAYNGKPPFQKKYDIALLFNPYIGMLAWFVRPGEGMNTFEDLKGKVLSIRTPFLAYATEVNNRIAAYYGLDKTAKITTNTGAADVRDKMINKTVDASYWDITAGDILAIKQSKGLQLLECSQELLDKVLIPGTTALNLPPYLLATYDLPLDKKFLTWGYVNSHVVRADMPDHIVYGILEAIYGDKHLGEVMGLSTLMAQFSLELAARYSWIPFHPAAVQFYKDKGVWSKGYDKRQQELLAEPRR